MRHKGLAFVLAFLNMVMGLILLSFEPAALAQTLAHLESPSPSSFQESGVSLIRGWVCAASRVEVSIDGGPLLVTAHGTDRPDTAQACGDTRTGFGLTYNWNRTGDGVHNLRAFADGVEFANVNFAVATLGGEYLTGLLGEYTIPDFPAPGSTTKLRWSEAHQNFVVVNPIAIPPVTNPPVQSGARLESPTQGSSESGVGLIRGWVCAASRVEVSIDGGPLLATAHGTDRPDTAPACGDTNNGFGLTYNWNRVGNGVHNLRAFADGVEFANVNFAVTTLGSEYLTGLNSTVRLLDFPGAGPATAAHALAASGPTTTVAWSEPHQNFLVAVTTATGEKLARVAALPEVGNRFAVLGVGAAPASQTAATGVQVVKDAAGAPTQITGVTWADTQSGGWTDLALGADNLPATYRDSNGNEARLGNYTATGVEVRFFDAAGRLVAGPVIAPLNVDWVRELQDLANRVRQTASGTAAAFSAARGVVTQASAAMPFSLSPVQAEMLGTGSTAAGETLCALQRAAATAGVGNLVAPTACQSPLIQGFLTLAAATPQRAVADSLLRQTLPQALQFDRDVVPTPCDPASSSLACLTPAATELQARVAQPVPELPWQAPSPPPKTYSYSGTWEHCLTVTPDYGVRQTCSSCGSGPAQITLQNGSMLLNAQAWHTTYEVNANGNCRGVAVTFQGPLSWTVDNAYANGSIAFSYTITTQSGATHPIDIRGSYSDTALSASGSVSYSTQLSTGPVNIIDQDRFSLSTAQ